MWKSKPGVTGHYLFDDSDTRVGIVNPECAQVIVRAVNSHRELLEALEAVVSIADRDTVEFDMARAAIERART